MKGMEQGSMPVVIPTSVSVRQLDRLKEKGGLTMGVMLWELARYIALHEQAGCELDMGGQALRFDDSLSVVIKKMEGIWHVLRIWRHAARLAVPVIRWRRVRRGFETFIAKVLVGWRYLVPAEENDWRCLCD